MSDGMSEAFGQLRRKERESNRKKYIVFYVRNSEPKVRKFETLEEAEEFSNTIEEVGDPMNTWVDYIVKGKIISEVK